MSYSTQGARADMYDAATTAVKTKNHVWLQEIDMRLKKNEILVWKRCKKDNISNNDFKYPKKGWVEAPDWNDRKVCGGGLHGWTLGFETYFDKSLEGNLVLLKVNKNDGYVELDDKVKFRKGYVVLNTPSIEKAHKAILDVYPTVKLHWSTANQGPGSVANQGDESTANQGHDSTANQRSGSTANQGYKSTANQGYKSTANQGHDSTANQGHDSTANQRSGSTANQGYWSTANQGNESTANQGYKSTANQGHDSTANQGNESVSVHRFTTGRTSIVRFAKNSVAVLYDDSGKPHIYSKCQDKVVYFFDSKPHTVYTHTPDSISKLQKHEVFVFGSNKAGNHMGGAAKLAVKKFGAEIGTGEGSSGQSYAIPTLDEEMKPVSLEDLEKSITRFVEHAYKETTKIFLVTKIGCGIAGFKEEQIKGLFKRLPGNVVMPKGWL